MSLPTKVKLTPRPIGVRSITTPAMQTKTMTSHKIYCRYILIVVDRARHIHRSNINSAFKLTFRVQVGGI